MMININGIAHEVEGDLISYEDVLRLAKIPATGASVTYFARGEGDSYRSGTMYSGKTIKLADGMQIDAVRTNNA